MGGSLCAPVASGLASATGLGVKAIGDADLVASASRPALVPNGVALKSREIWEEGRLPSCSSALVPPGCTIPSDSAGEMS